MIGVQGVRIFLLAAAFTTLAPVAVADPAAQGSRRDKQGIVYDQDYNAPAEPFWIRIAEDYHLRRAIELYGSELRQGVFPYQGARADLAFILERAPNHPEALARLSDIAVKAKQPEWVMPYFERSFALFPPHPRTTLIYAVYLQKLGKTGDAIAQHRKALTLDPDLADAHYNLGLALFDQKKYTEANAHAQKAYAAGHPYPGLRNRLKQVGAWQETAENPSKTSSKAVGGERSVQ